MVETSDGYSIFISSNKQTLKGLLWFLVRFDFKWGYVLLKIKQKDVYLSF